MNARLTRKIRELGAKNGVDLIGIAPIERFAEAPDGHKPQNILPSAKTVVSIALNALEGTFSTELFHTYQLSYALLRSRTNDISYQLAKYLESEGYSSVMIPGTVPLDMVERKGLFGAFSHRHAAQAAGLGKIGLNQLLITESFGPRIWLGTVITSAPLIPSPIPTKTFCLGKDCNLCVKSCGPKALSMNGIDKKRCLEKGVHAENLSGLLKHATKILEAKTTKEKKELLWSADTRVLYQSLVCGMIPACKSCLAICPIGKRCV